MAYDTDLADRIRFLIGTGPGVTEKKMFGGLAFLVGEERHDRPDLGRRPGRRQAPGSHLRRTPRVLDPGPWWKSCA